MITLCIIIAILLLLILVAFLPMHFGVEYEKTEKQNKLHIYLRILGMVIHFPIHTKHDKPARAKKKNTKNTKPAKRPLSYNSFRENIHLLSEVYETSKNELLDILSYVREHLRCKEIHFDIRFGLDDAAKTGIATGVVWSSGTLLLKMIDALIGIEQIKMNVYPDFNDKKFEIYTKTILIMQPFRFIIIVRRVEETIKFIQSKIN